jgi:hypothetical protein
MIDETPTERDAIQLYTCVLSHHFKSSRPLRWTSPSVGHVSAFNRGVCVRSTDTATVTTLRVINDYISSYASRAVIYIRLYTYIYAYIFTSYRQKSLLHARVKALSWRFYPGSNERRGKLGTLSSKQCVRARIFSCLVLCAVKTARLVYK